MTDHIDAMDVPVAQRRLSRRSLLRGALAFGIAVPISGGLLAACTSGAPATAPTQAAAVAPTVAKVAAQAAPTVAAAATQLAPTIAAAATQVAPTIAAVATQVAPAITGAKFNVSILGQQMSRDEVIAGLKKEGEVNVANWTYTANDAIVGRFQDVVKSDWGVDVKCNYLQYQEPSGYLHNLY